MRLRFWCALLLPQSFPLSASSAGLQCWAEVASLLCANSALIQELFYAVKGTCDREKEGERGGVEATISPQTCCSLINHFITADKPQTVHVLAGVCQITKSEILNLQEVM